MPYLGNERQVQFSQQQAGLTKKAQEVACSGVNDVEAHALGVTVVLLLLVTLPEGAGAPKSVRRGTGFIVPRVECFCAGRVGLAGGAQAIPAAAGQQQQQEGSSKVGEGRSCNARLSA